MTAFTSNRLLGIRTILLLLAMVNHLFSLVAADCYWPDGSTASDMQECYGANGADGLCCAPGDSCLMNHLCRNEIDRSLYRGACNLQNWTQGMTCPQFCTSREYKNNMTNIQIVDECFEAPGFYVCHTGVSPRNTCFDWNNPLFMLYGRSAGFAVWKMGVALTIPGCDEEYNTAGNPTPLTDIPSCSKHDGVPSPWTIGPTSTFSTRFVPTALLNPVITRALQVPRGSYS
jgi:hypothetical protein